jgi:hypothetical protein
VCSPVSCNRFHPQGAQAHLLRFIQALEKVFVIVAVHQEADRAAMHTKNWARQLHRCM